MKQCPVCNLTYTDARLSFCLEDSATLFSVPAAQSNTAETQPSQRVNYTATPNPESIDNGVPAYNGLKRTYQRVK